MEKLLELKKYISRYGKACVAYSGGVDSDFVLNVTKDVLGTENVVAIIANGAMLAKKDLNDAIRLAEHAGIKYYVLDLNAFEVSEFASNDKMRCYFCKKNIMIEVIKKAEELGFDFVFDGKNADDGKVFRPGGTASEELGIISPLFECDYSKDKIRESAKNMDLLTWNKPSNSCLATRFPYNTNLNPEMFKAVEEAEQIISDLGITSGRVRIHGDIARIELPKKFIGKFSENETAIQKIKDIGFKYITLDLEGFRSGSME